MSAKDQKTEIGTAWAAHRDSRHQDAINGFNNILGADVNNLDAYYGRGLAQRALGMTDAALNSFQEALQRVEQSMTNHNDRAQNFGKLKTKHEDALKLFNQAIRALEQSGDGSSAEMFRQRHAEALVLGREAVEMTQVMRQNAVDQAENNRFSELQSHYNKSLAHLEELATKLQTAGDTAETYQQYKAQYRSAMEDFYDVFGPMEQSFLTDRRVRDRFLMLKRMVSQRIEETSTS